MIYFITSARGGAGKSLFAEAFAYYLETQNRRIQVIDLDTDNPDVATAIKSELNIVINFKTPDIKIASLILGQILKADEDTDIIVNTPSVAIAGTLAYISSYIKTNIKNNVIEKDFCKHIFLCTTGVESKSFLSKRVSVFDNVIETFVVRNDRFSLDPDWSFLNSIDLKSEKLCDMPYAGERFLNALKKTKTGFKNTLATSDKITRIQLSVWLERMNKTFETIMKTEEIGTVSTIK